MLHYILKRLIWLIPILLGVTFIVFMLMQVAPGDPATLVLGADVTEENRAEWMAEQGLDKPVLVQYGSYIYNVVTKLDFGNSYKTDIPIAKEIKRRLPVTLLVVLVAIGLTQLVGVPIGVISAVKQYSFIDNLTMLSALVAVSMPSFWVGLMFSIIFALNLRWLPASGLYGAKYLILPCTALSLSGIALAARMTRSTMLDVIRQDYITTARAKGVPESVVIYKHALRNTLIPVITGAGLGISMLIGGAMVTEIVFSIPGMGTYLVNSIRGMDYPAVLGTVIVLATFSTLIMLLVDLAYALVDPRIRSQFKSKKSLGKGIKA